MDNEAPSKDPVTGRWYLCEHGGPTGICKYDGVLFVQLCNRIGAPRIANTPNRYSGDAMPPSPTADSTHQSGTML